MRRGFQIILFIVVLDAMGIGIVFPILPSLLRELLHRGDVARHYGYLLAAYAVSMFFASPVLGSLSDRYGRRPILLASLLGTACDDLVMALAPTLPILYAGRTLAGLTGANMTVANAYLADLTAPEERATAFGRMNAGFGVGFILGPLLGGSLGAFSLRAPFYLAAALNLLGAVLCHFALPESRVAGPTAMFSREKLNPFTSLLSIRKLHGTRLLLYVFCTMAMVGQVPSVLWVLYGTERFGWSAFAVGCSFALFGALHAVCQALLPGVAQRKLGQKGTVIAGMTVDALAYVTFSLVSSARAAFAAIPLLSLGGVAEPAVQAILAGAVEEDRQGELQGILTSLVSLIAVIGPVAVSAIYVWLKRTAPWYPGAIWLLTVLLYAPCVFLLLSERLRSGAPGRWRKEEIRS